MLAPQFRVPMFEYVPDANVGDVRKLTRGFFERCHVRDFTQSDADHLAPFPMSKPAKILRGNGITFSRVQFIPHLPEAAASQADFRLAEPEQSAGITPQSRRANTGDSEEMEERGLS